MTFETIQHSLVELHPQERPNIELDIVYATKNNFMGQVLYPSAHCFLHSTVKEALLKVAEELFRMGLGIKVYDCYRPLAVQKMMWDKIQDERYVSNPYKFKGRHTRGTAVDLTLIDKKGIQLQMPTEFDSFEERAASDYPDLPSEIKQNRFILRKMMEKHGFNHLPTEWWHYDFNGWEDESTYPALDLLFEDLLKGS